jgi:flavin-dependent dehydrogenase
VVLACGFNPQLTEKLGLENPSECLEGCQKELDLLDEVNETEVYVGRDIAPGSFAWIVPANRKKARIGVTTRRNGDLFLRSFLTRPMIRDRLANDGGVINSSLIPIRPIRKSFSTRALVVGEAAGLVKSTTCGGIYYGLISARFSAETVEEAFSQGRFDDLTLRRYEYRWRHELGEEFDIGFRLRQVLFRFEDKQIDRLFKILNSDGVAQLIAEKARFDWHKDFILLLSKHMVFRKYLSPFFSRAMDFNSGEPPKKVPA